MFPCALIKMISSIYSYSSLLLGQPPSGWESLRGHNYPSQRASLQRPLRNEELVHHLGFCPEQLWMLPLWCGLHCQQGGEYLLYFWTFAVRPLKIKSAQKVPIRLLLFSWYLLFYSIPDWKGNRDIFDSKVLQCTFRMFSGSHVKITFQMSSKIAK